MTPVEIVGGGLSGLSLGIALRTQGVPVTVKERGRYPRHKVCGEFVCGVSDETLESLGIAEMFSDAPRYTESAWFTDEKRILDESLPRPARGISRWVMDQWLQKKFVSLGGNLLTGENVARTGEVGRVWAAGREATSGSPWVGLKAHIRNYTLAAELEMHMGRGGYAGLVAVEDGWVNVCGLFRRRSGLRGRGKDLMVNYLEACGLRALGDQVRMTELRENSFCAVAGFELGRQENADGLCVLGDAESMIPPFTGNGMSMAFEAADLATDPLLAFSRSDLSWDACRASISQRLTKRFQTRLITAGACHPAILSPAGHSLLAAAHRGRMLPFQTLFSLSH